MLSASYSELLKNNRNFRNLWAGQMISELGSWFSFIAELGLVRMLSGSPLATTALLVARVLPFLLVAPAAGVLVDRLSRKRILIVADLLRAVVALSYIAAGALGSVWMVVACAALNSSLTMFFEAAKNASIPNMVTQRELLTANVLMFSTRFLHFMLGSALGGLTAAQFGYNAAFVVNSLSFVASALFILPIPAALTRKSGRESESGPPAKRAGFFTDLREGLGYIWATPFVRGIIMVNVGWATGGGMANILFDQLGGHVFNEGAGDRGDWSVAMLFTASGAGLFLGMMLARRAGAWVAGERRAGHFIGWSLILHGVFFAAAGMMPSLLLTALWIAASRFVLGMEFGVQETLMMRVLPDDYRGRVFTTDRSLEFGMMSLSMMAGGWLLTQTSVGAVMVVSGLLAASPGLAWMLAMWLSRFRVPEAALRESYGD
ncbi:MAG TPA: MFS transporter [Blastocatellia bacterium]|nr:MFS transporter [Blastocatellia bacterium]